MVDKKITDKMKKEIEQDKKTYLLNCKEYYNEYVEAAREMFSEYYDLDREKGEYWYETFTKKALEAKQHKKTETEKLILEKAIKEDINTPHPYERLAILYSKEKDFQKAYDVCKKWFNSVYWKIPNMATTSLKILDRMVKLEKSLK